MKLIYIAGPMSGLPDYNYPAFELAEEMLKLSGYRSLNPVAVEQLNPTPGMHQEWDWYMRQSLRMVLRAEGVALLDNWYESRGATLEVHVAAFLKIPVHPLAVWLAGEREPLLEMDPVLSPEPKDYAPRQGTVTHPARDGELMVVHSTHESCPRCVAGETAVYGPRAFPFREPDMEEKV